LCLSHRWGGSKIIPTTTATLEARKASIPFIDMPKTFQDAIRVTRFLGYQYLWVDSLCILQDKLDDWEKEAGKMGDIYRNAVVTTVASGATSADSGCFVGDSHSFPCELGTFTIHQGCADQEHEQHPCAVFASPPVQVQPYARRHDFRPRGPLDTRGWVLQEEIMSARSLVFAAEGAYWECLSNVASEADPMGRNWCNTATIMPNPKGGGSILASLAWCHMVENDSAREFTKESDRLVALQGLINVMGKTLGHRCQAGLWEGPGILTYQLVWQRALVAKPLARPRRQREGIINLATMPSWSWAQVNQQVHFPTAAFRAPNNSLLIEILNVDTREGNGRIAGRLTVKGIIKTVLAMPRKLEAKGRNPWL
ncbi:heterokaryon incompatibility protein-domain-containing protein, partial [Podospora didyma]